MIRGNDTTIVDVLGKRWRAHYAVFDVNTPAVSYRLRRKDYGDRLSAANEEDALNYKPELVVSSLPYPHDGPPVIGHEFEVEAGNRRTEVARLLRDMGRYGQYKDRLISHAEDFGLSPEAVAGQETPFLTRVRDETFWQPGGQERFAALANVRHQDVQTAAEEAARDSRTFDRLLSGLRGWGVGEFDALMASDGAQGALSEIVRSAPAHTFAGAVETDQWGVPVLTEAGRNRVVHAMLSRVFTDPMSWYMATRGI